ncbi:MAG: SDR family oxidoreductase [Cyclobacteriaceae bacterium]|nr:SDR family oxidoreductase [Cyclobacteriaceae bacterium]
MLNTSMLKEGTFKGKTILITGGGTGLGKSMGKYLSQLGGNLIITGRRSEVLEETAKEIEKETGHPVLPVAGDIRKMEDVEQVITMGIQKFGSIDYLINNAAGNFISPTEALSHRAFESVLGIVLQGTINCTLSCGKYWIKNKIKGVVLNIVTTYAWTGTGYTVPSACAKAGVLAMTRSLAAEWGRKYGIRLTAIAPGPFPTKGAWDRLFPKKLHDLAKPESNVPLGRVGEHQELANLAAYLLSDYAAYINGEVVTIDGGEWLENAGEFNWLKALSQEDWIQISQTIKAEKNK